jgi:hypothetical protein
VHPSCQTLDLTATHMTTITPEQLLAEIEDVLRTMPPRATIRHNTDENHAWLGRASAVVGLWDRPKAITFDANVTQVHGGDAHAADRGLRGVLTMLQRARHELRMQTVGPMTVAIDQGGVFDYFDEVRKVIEGAKVDLFFVDPFLDAEFVSRYLPHVSPGVLVRLLGRERLQTLVPAVTLLRQQANLSIEVRSAGGFHDRYVFVDKANCYQSGASFKDGAKKAPTTLTQITDAFAPVCATYEQIWATAAIHQ